MYPRNTHWHRRYEIDGWSPAPTGRQVIEASMRCCGGSASSQSNPSTYTTSGEYSPVVSGSSGAVATQGSIGLGSGATYQEQGSIDLAGAQNVGGAVGGNISTGSDSTITVGNPLDTQTMAAMAQNFANTVGSIDAGAGSLITTLQGQQQSMVKYLTWGLIGLGALIVLKFVFGKS